MFIQQYAKFHDEKNIIGVYFGENIDFVLILPSPSASKSIFLWRNQPIKINLCCKRKFSFIPGINITTDCIFIQVSLFLSLSVNILILRNGPWQDIPRKYAYITLIAFGYLWTTGL